MIYQWWLEKELEVKYVLQYIGMQKKIISNKHMKNYQKNIESSYLMYLDVHSLYGWKMPQKLTVNGFKWKQIYINLKKTS